MDVRRESGPHLAGGCHRPLTGMQEDSGDSRKVFWALANEEIAVEGIGVFF